MCAKCLHWKADVAQDIGGLRFAPCALVPDKDVPDNRVPSGFVTAAYVMQGTYTCNRFTQKE